MGPRLTLPPPPPQTLVNIKPELDDSQEWPRTKNKRLTCLYLSYSNNSNFPNCGIRWEMAFKPTYIHRKTCLPIYILCVELSRFLSRRL